MPRHPSTLPSYFIVVVVVVVVVSAGVLAGSCLACVPDAVVVLALWLAE
jgi:hypothetical protein